MKDLLKLFDKKCQLNGDVGGTTACSALLYFTKKSNLMAQILIPNLAFKPFRKINIAFRYAIKDIVDTSHFHFSGHYTKVRFSQK